MGPGAIGGLCGATSCCCRVKHLTHTIKVTLHQCCEPPISRCKNMCKSALAENRTACTVYTSTVHVAYSPGTGVCEPTGGQQGSPSIWLAWRYKKPTLALEFNVYSTWKLKLRVVPHDLPLKYLLLRCGLSHYLSPRPIGLAK